MMNAKNQLIAVSGLIIAVISVNYFLKNDRSVLTATTPNTSEKTALNTNQAGIASTTTATTAQPKAAKTQQKVDYRYMQERIEAMQQRRPNMTFEPADVAAAIERDVAWKPVKELPKELPLKPEEFTDGREFISLDSLKIETLMPGDKMRVPIKSLNKEYEVIIDNIEKHDYNSISWNGHIEGGDGRNYNATFTRGESLTVGGVDTPDGQYELQAHGNNGWIASANLLFKNHVDPIDPNTVVPGAVPVQQKK